MLNILVVDDDPHIRALLRFYLQKEGYKTLEAGDGQEALDVLKASQAHLAIVDVMMPHIDGYELCREIRSDYDIPVLMLTAKGEMADKEKGFTAGTDDYVVKPFEPKEILFRIQALLRRYQMVNEQTIHVGQTTINRKNYEIEVNGKVLILPLKEFELLTQLASYPDQIFSREQLLELVWGRDYEGSDRTIDVHIKRLREQFANDESGFKIETVRGLGYKLIIH